MDALAPLRRWLLLVFMLGIVASATALAFGRNIYDLYVWEFVAPKLQYEMGFRIGGVRMISDESSSEVPGIVVIEPGGIFDKAGFQVGDIPVGYVHGFVGFYHHLNSARGKTTTFTILRPEDGGSWEKSRERSVTVPGRGAVTGRRSAGGRVGNRAPIAIAGKDVPAPRLLKKVEPTLPKSELAKHRVQPRLLAEVLIDEQGRVENVALVKTNDSSLTPYILAAIRQWEYSPTHVKGQAVRVRHHVMFWSEVR